jgi:hypothetical protein
MTLIIIVLLLALWLGLAVIGFMFKAFLWVAIVALALFVITAIGGAVHHTRGKR